MDATKDKFPDLPERISGLGELAYNLWWSWHPAARMSFKILNRATWKLCRHNPVKMLHTIDKEILIAAVKSPEYLKRYDAIMSRFKTYMISDDGWFYKNVTDSGRLPIAYMSAEYGLHHSLPFYAGGLGFLAGDFLKECSDLGVPMVAVGFMYPGGYLRQRIGPDGWQASESEPLDREHAPICRVFDNKGNPLVVKVPVIEPPIHVGVWKVQIGRVPLYLIDTEIEVNSPWNRGISARLYIGDPEQRLRQQIVLGIGGIRVLNALGIKHGALHLNEDHPAFAILERIRRRVEEGISYEEASEQVRATTLFTVHTSIPAGHDVFSSSLMDKHFHSYWQALKLQRDAFYQLGINPKEPKAGFDMTTFALKMSAYHNSVSKRHEEVTRKMWRHLWPDLPEDKIPINHITNGVHVPTWIEPKLELLLNKYLGPRWLEGHDSIDVWRSIHDIQEEELWQTHCWLKMKLISQIKERARQEWINNPGDPRSVLASGVMLDPYALTIGFARRFVTYKRATLILHDPERLKKMLNNRWRPLQIIFAGKAHPDDDPGKRLLQQVFNAAKDPSFGGRIAFVEDYDEQLAQYLVHGVDIWLNNPLPPPRGVRNKRDESCIERRAASQCP